MIAGVRRRLLDTHADARGSLTELLRSDWEECGSGFGQAIMTVNLPGVIRGWHWHRVQTDRIVVLLGEAKVPLYDARPGSATHGLLEENILRGERLELLLVPPGVYHGYRTTSPGPALIVNFPDRTYDPQEPDEERVPFDAPEIGYRW